MPVETLKIEKKRFETQVVTEKHDITITINQWNYVQFQWRHFHSTDNSILRWLILDASKTLGRNIQYRKMTFWNTSCNAKNDIPTTINQWIYVQFRLTTTTIRQIIEFYIDWCFVSFQKTRRNVQNRKKGFETQIVTDITTTITQSIFVQFQWDHYHHSTDNSILRRLILDASKTLGRNVQYRKKNVLKHVREPLHTKIVGNYFKVNLKLNFSFRPHIFFSEWLVTNP
jgi:hypothetical protein